MLGLQQFNARRLAANLSAASESPRPADGRSKGDRAYRRVQALQPGTLPMPLALGNL
jgi:hypothetical protein